MTIRRSATLVAALAAALASGCNSTAAFAPDTGTFFVGACADALGHLSPAGTICRSSTGPCDAAETCTGASADCPPDVLAPAATICRASTGACDVAETCTGDSAGCPPDLLKPVGTLCRVAAGPCDVAETCEAGSAQCPFDAMRPNTVLCRWSADACDAEEWCTGASPECPEDLPLPAGTRCRLAVGSCDVPEVCSGVDFACPVDGFQPAGTSCPADTNPCTVDACGSDGETGQCVHPNVLDGTACADASICIAGACEEACLIDGMRYDPGAIDPLQPCQGCAPSEHTASWTSREDLACEGTGVCQALACESDPQNALWPLPPESPTDYQVDADTVTDRVTGLLWQRAVSPTDLDYAQAASYCEALDLGGFSSGWRVPALIELLSIVDSGAATAPAINADAFPETPAAHFWSSTVGNDTMLDGERWGVDFTVGSAFRDRWPTPIPTSRVRCIRSEPQAPRERYTVGADTVKDELTGLTWERSPTLTLLDQAGAETYCAGLALDGGGWRLPHKKELESLQDRREKDQALNTAAFGEAATCGYWASTPCSQEPGQAWTVGFKNGAVACYSTASLRSIRCVR